MTLKNKKKVHRFKFRHELLLFNDEKLFINIMLNLKVSNRLRRIQIAKNLSNFQQEF